MGNIFLRSNNSLVKTAQLLLIIGFILCLGSICSFIAMNIVLSNSPSIIPIYWNRLFVTKITHILIVPGLWLVLITGIFLTWKEYGVLKTWWISVLQIVILLAFIIGILVITPLSDQVTALAIEQMHKQVILPEYQTLKNREDSFGIVNFLILICTLIFTVNNSYYRKQE